MHLFYPFRCSLLYLQLKKSSLHIKRAFALAVCVLLASQFGSAGALASGYAETTTSGHGAVASVNPLATQVGLDVFARGGNALDAAAAVAFALGVVDSHNSGIGGGCFILVHTASGETYAFDGREMAPGGATRDMFIQNGEAVSDLSKTGALAIGVPGSVAALFQMQKRGGKLRFKDVLLPSATLAEQGFPIDKVLAVRLAKTAPKLAQFPPSAAIFMPSGKALAEGDLLVQKDLAHTYRLLAKHGPKYFYQGEFAQRVHAWMSKHGGIVTQKDFANYAVIERAPIQTDAGPFTVLGFPPPSSGGVHVAQILAMLDANDVSSMKEADRYHYIIEANKLAFADRAEWLGDSDFVSVPRGLIDPKYMQKRGAEIHATKATGDVRFGLPPSYKTDIFSKHTTHVATADTAGNWVAITTTLNTSFGSKVTIPGTGVLMNNQMDDFSAQPGVPNAFGLVGAEANAVAPGKRPLSSMSPTIVMRDGKPVMTLGAAGGPTIISQVSQTIFNHLFLKKPLSQAMSAPRVHHQWKPNMVFIDKFASEGLHSELEARGHILKVWPAFGATQAISLDKGKLVAESEPRIQ